ncbi:ribokinase [Nocardioides sp. OK12]|nr:ribokinase [Nocardioides sp. OK12]
MTYGTFMSVTNVQECEPTASHDVVTLGEPLICLTAADGRLPSTSHLVKSVVGAESNVAIGLARLGRSSALVSRVGQDPFGDEVVRTLRGEGVDTRWIVRDPDEVTGLMIKERRAPDDIHAYYYRRGSAAAGLTPADVDEQAVAGARRVHVTGITLALGQGPREATARMVQLAGQSGVPVSFDPNFRLKLWSEQDAATMSVAFLPSVSDLLVGEDELLAMAQVGGAARGLPAALRWLESYDLCSVVVKRGAAGVVGVKDGVCLERPAYPVAAVVDTVGAGDAFNVGYLHATLGGADLGDALDSGRWVASRVVSHLGDYEGLPSASEYAAHLAEEEVAPR